jgi:hypothetical protein
MDMTFVQKYSIQLGCKLKKEKEKKRETKRTLVNSS